MKSITIIIPVHEYCEAYLRNALTSIKVNDSEYYTLLFVGPKEVCSKCVDLYKELDGNIEYSVVENNETEFAEQINKAVFSTVTPYFTILEYDDEFTDVYFKFMQRYIDEYPSYSLFLPINELYDASGNLVSFANEIALNPAFNDNEQTFGFITKEELDTFMDFSCTGGLFKTEDFISVGGLKKSLKIAAWYEFLYRLVYKQKSIYVVPKIGYKHLLGRTDSYMDKQQKLITKEEGQFLINLAREEYFFKEDRGKKFEPENKE